jgi:hypothetical protein
MTRPVVTMARDQPGVTQVIPVPDAPAVRAVGAPAARSLRTGPGRKGSGPQSFPVGGKR